MFAHGKARQQEPLAHGSYPPNLQVSHTQYVPYAQVVQFNCTITYQHNTEIDVKTSVLRFQQTVDKASHCPMSRELQGYRCVHPLNQQTLVVYAISPAIVRKKNFKNKESKNISRVVHNFYVSSHFGPWAFIEGLASSSNRTVDIFCIAFGDIGYDFPCTWIQSWKCLP
ncbi:hypothetical protein Hanom_Chr02g00098001 [Helianthus anomalus]